MMGARIWTALTKPWLAPLMADVAVCRLVVGVCGTLGLANLAGLPIWTCPLNHFTGLPCPGCGMTRAVSALVIGHWSQAMHFHPFSPAYLVIGVLLGVAAVVPPNVRNALIAKVEWIEAHTALPALIVLFTIIFGLLRLAAVCSTGLASSESLLTAASQILPGSSIQSYP
jgi:Protein of unknown function (DUF2752)